MPGHFLRRQPRFYKTECLSCDMVIKVSWERDVPDQWVNTKRPPLFSSDVCPLCDTPRLQTFPINEKEYLDINQKWDLVDSSKETEDGINRWLQENT